MLRPVAWRRPPPPDIRILRNPEIIPQPATTPPEQRRAAWFHLLVFSLLFFLPLGQLAATGSEQRAQAEAARRAVQLATSIAASGERSAFLTNSVQAAHTADIQAAVRTTMALETTTARDTQPELEVANAETAVAAQLRRMAEHMGRIPSHADGGIDPATITALGAEPEQWPAMRVEQNRQADLAEQAGNRALLLAAATAIGVVAEYLMAAAISAGRRRWLYWPAGAAAVSVVLAAAAFI
ncbi:hypothetical protein [Streptomyces sp. SID12488]|uniref:hypothetical protein n=1 Tax=Streptomyces sp. SID12488 TaxID=2706040 RepID=UPI0013D94A46|nr:hypothetical protein [Streptomyces sp. SID12488]NEA67460.1 hypothetical protein [Streptomyces sp. SID12488]